MNRVLKPIPKLTVLAIAAGLSLAACGGSDSNSEPAKPVALTGVFLDGAVEGLDYVAGSAAKASTNAKGEFTCTPRTWLPPVASARCARSKTARSANRRQSRKSPTT